jgi:peptidoglycan/LPS O-acetylase OafA/YrhL
LHAGIKYRPEIDGLRAVAVLPVVLFHAGFSAFGGGYVGVDVFFVISGYLITTLILRDVEAGTFSFRDFYERRARRILPALFLVLLCCIPFAWMWMMPDEMRNFSRTLSSVILFTSNISLWERTGYFDQAAELNPLLHTWSLAVEEQFYIIFPLIVLLLWRFGRGSLVTALLLIAGVSLALSEYASRSFPSFNFFWLPTRAWELMAGALCAFLILRPNLKRDEALSLAGLAAIVLSVVLFDATTPFPSLYALLPVLGTCAIILFAVPGTLVHSLLSARVLVGVGLISYSAYLWHQPLFAFARIRSLIEPSPLLMAGLAVAAFGLAYISWRFVEMPFRRRGSWPLPGWRSVALASVTAAALLLAFGKTGNMTKGFPERFASRPEIITAEQRLTANHGLSERCERFRWLEEACRTEGDPEVVVWGDSLAMHLVDGLRASKPDLRMVQMTTSVCGPFAGLAPVNARNPVAWAERCMAFNDKVLEFIAAHRSIRYVVLGSRFEQYVGKGARVLLRDGSVTDGGEIALEHLMLTLDKLESLGVTPVVFAPPPEPGYDAGNCLSRALLLHKPPETCSFSLKEAAERQHKVREMLAHAGERFKVIWLDDALCQGDLCLSGTGKRLFLRDAWHLSHEGSAAIGKTKDFFGLLAAPSPH